jgi:hypothetical protein
MNDKNVIISEDRLAVVLAYLADKAPEGLAQRREWARCMSILSAQRKEAPGPDTHTCWTCTLRMSCAATSSGGCDGYTTDAAKMPSPDAAAGRCGGCILRGNCDEDTMPGGCPKYVGKQTATPPPQYAPATVAFPAYVTRDELDMAVARLQAKYEEVQCENSDLAKQVRELDKDHVDLLKCYIYHLREHMPEALRNAGEIAPKSKSCQTCHHFAVCDDIRQGKCESWEQPK